MDKYVQSTVTSSSSSSVMSFSSSSSSEDDSSSSGTVISSNAVVPYNIQIASNYVRTLLILKILLQFGTDFGK